MDIKKISKLSIIIPCYNEQATIELIVKEVLAAPTGGTRKEIIIVDDHSTDDAPGIIKDLVKRHDEVKAIFQPKNQGKTAALKRGFAQSTGDVVIVQDGDREYDPRDYDKLLTIFREDRADIVFGSRFSGGAPRRVVYLA
ncbi:MAG: glycosyltransferase family 2 protein, partial [Candidatus Saccharimonadales bacterium]